MFYESSVADPGRLSRIRTFSIPDPHQRILTQKKVSKLSEIWSGLFFQNPDPDFLPIPDSGVSKAPEPGYRIRNTLMTSCLNEVFFSIETNADPKHCLYLPNTHVFEQRLAMHIIYRRAAFLPLQWNQQGCPKGKYLFTSTINNCPVFWTIL